MIKKSFLCSMAMPGLRTGVALPGLALYLGLLGTTGAAYAQDAVEATPAKDSDTPQTQDSDIVVTGTLVRGIAPPGTDVIGVTREDVASTGATTTSQLLQTIPQFNAFNTLQFPANSGNTVTVNRPNLRNLPGNTTAGGSTTLVLMNGHRLVGMGVSSTTPDPDVIPPGVIERVEIVPDGGSAIYGADAVAGVVNFITRKRFDGLQVDAHYGFADEYHQFDANVTAGKEWGNGGLFVSYSYNEHDRIRGLDRDYLRQTPDATGFTSLNCNPGTVRLGTAAAPLYYALPYASPPVPVAGLPNQCDASDDVTLFPGQSQHSVFAGFSQDLNDALSVDISAFYTHRDIVGGGGTFQPRTGVAVPNGTTVAGPAFGLNFGGHRIGAETSQTVLLGFGPPDGRVQHITLDTWGVNPTLTANLGGGWQLRVLGGYGRSVTQNDVGSFNPTALTNAVNVGLFNPYDVSLPSNQAAYSIITNYHLYGRAVQEMFNARAVIDGDLLTLPGGAVKLAAGLEYISEHFRSRAGDSVPGFEATGAPSQSIGATLIAPAAAALPLNIFSRNVKSVFGELVVPLFGADNATGGLQQLTVSASGRYDYYSDFKGTFNPKFGLTWKPIDWLTLRGSWGKSFNAPSLADDENALARTLQVTAVTQFSPPASLQTPSGGNFPVPINTQSVYVRQGNAVDIKPQTAKTMSVGFDVQPPFIPGLKLGLTYFNIKLKGVIAIPPGQSAALVYGGYPTRIITDPTTAQLDAVAAGSNSFPFGNPCHLNPVPCSVYAIVDLRKNNQGDFKLDGFDFDLKYRHSTSFGALSLAFNGSWEINRGEQTDPTQPFDDVLARGASGFKARTSVGAEIGNLTGQVIWNHTAGYDLRVPVGFVPQSRIDAYDVFNLFLRYDVKGEQIFRDLSFTLNVDNVFDKDPPYSAAPCSGQPSGCGYINGNTLGRLVQFGVSKKF